MKPEDGAVQPPTQGCPAKASKPWDGVAALDLGEAGPAAPARKRLWFEEWKRDGKPGISSGI